MDKALVVGFEATSEQAITEILGKELGIKAIAVSSVEEAKNALNANPKEYLVLIYSLALTSDNYSPLELPTILITNAIPLKSQKIISAKYLVDYVVSGSKHNLEYIVQLIKRVRYSKKIKIIVSEEGTVTRRLMVNLLANKGLKVLEAANGIQAINLLRENPDVRLIITNSSLAKINGIDLVQNVRNKYNKNELPIIGLADECGEETEELSLSFLRHGANDFLSIPFKLEEFQARVMQNLQIVEIYHELKESSHRDFLTGLYNRRYFFDIGQTLFENARRGNLEILVAMIDIDRFKRINDSHGHAVGDAVIKSFSCLLEKNMRNSDVIARLGGEEFCVLTVGLGKENAFNVFERLRKKVEKLEVYASEDVQVQFTVSIGISSLKDTLEETVKRADELLYSAKETGRNHICMDF